MKTQYWWKAMGVVAVSVGLMVWPGAAMAADVDADGILDSLETAGGGGISFAGVSYPPCTGTPTQGQQRNACVSPTSKDIFIYLKTATGGGFLGANNLLTAEILFEFITPANSPVASGKVPGLGVGVHVKFVTAEVLSENRGVGSLGQKAAYIISDDNPDSFVYGVSDEGTPSATGNATVYPVKIRNYVVNTVKGTQDIWTRYIKRTFSHELSHVIALTAPDDPRYGHNHYATGSGVVMDQSAVCNTSKHTCTIYDKYASGDIPCLTRVDASNPLQCIGFP